MSCRVGNCRALRRLFAKLADLTSWFFRFPFFLDSGKGTDSLFMARMNKPPPGMFEFGREKADGKEEKEARRQSDGTGHRGTYDQ